MEEIRELSKESAVHPGYSRQAPWIHERASSLFQARDHGRERKIQPGEAFRFCGRTFIPLGSKAAGGHIHGSVHRRKHSGTLYPGAAGTVRQLSLCGHAVLPVQGGLCPCDRQRNGGEDGFRFPSGTGEAALEKLVRHGKTG